MLGHDPALLGLADRLGAPQDVYCHDYARFCPRIALVPEHAYCGEPPVSGLRGLRRRSRQQPGGGDRRDRPGRAVRPRCWPRRRRVVAPAADVASRIRRHFPGIRAEVDAAGRTTPPSRRRPSPPAGPPRSASSAESVSRRGTRSCSPACATRPGADCRSRFTLVGSQRGRCASARRRAGLHHRPLSGGGGTEPDPRSRRPTSPSSPPSGRKPGVSPWPTPGAPGCGRSVFDAWRARGACAAHGVGAWVLPLGLSPAAINDWWLRMGPAPITLADW